MVNSFSGAMLAGGQSRRMGQDKSRMEIHIPGQGRTTSGDAVLTELDMVCEDVMIVGGESLYPDRHSHYLDTFHGGGVLSGIHSALSYASYEYVFITGCDMPFLDVNTISAMFALASGFDVTVPIVDGRAETLHAVYRVSCIEPIRHALNSGKRRVVEFFPAVHVREISENDFKAINPSGHSNRNINSPRDVEQAIADRLLQGNEGSRS